MSARRACTGLGGAIILLSVLGCSLDLRHFSQVSDSTGGSGNSASGGNSDVPRAGSGGAASIEPLPTDCDYSKAARPECQSLVKNPGFAVDVAGWLTEPGPITLTWKGKDANDDANSGSLSLLNAFYGETDAPIALGAYQCLPATPGVTYAMAGDVWIPKGQGDGADGGPYTASAGFSVIFKDDSACAGHTLSNFTSDLVSDSEVWTHLDATGAAPQGTGSMDVRLVTLKNFREFQFEAWFDNVLVTTR